MKLTQKDVSEILKMPKSSYQQYESGSHKMNPEIMIKFANFYNVTLDELLCRETPSRYVKVSMDERRILTAYQTLDSRDKRVIRVMLKEMNRSENEISVQHSIRHASRSTRNPAQEEPELDLLENSEELSDVPEDI